jgi:transcriptional regulator with XRE-family HTH domain
MDKKNYREVLGERLRAFREEKGLSAYRVAQKGKIRISQVNAVESGGKNYTIDILLGYLSGTGLYMFFAEKEDTKERNS